MTILIILLMLVVGMTFSALFSGSETGFYRVTRVRLVLDAMSGDRIAHGLLQMTNQPAFFVATTLVGNNLANYITSLAIVLGAMQMTGGGSQWVEMAAPVLMAPLVFIYGELLPKYLFYRAPNRLLRLAGPVFLLCALLFLPVSIILWAVGRFLQRLFGEAPEQVRLRLARAELQGVLQEGQHAGLLSPSQRTLAENLVAVASKPVLDYATPIGRVVAVKLGAKTSEVLRLARRHQLAETPIEEPGTRRLIGYVRTLDLHLDDNEEVQTARPIIEIAADTPYIAAMSRLRSTGETLAKLTDKAGEVVGLVHIDSLTKPLFQ